MLFFHNSIVTPVLSVTGPIGHLLSNEDSLSSHCQLVLELSFRPQVAPVMESCNPSNSQGSLGVSVCSVPALPQGPVPISSAGTAGGTRLSSFPIAAEISLGKHCPRQQKTQETRFNPGPASCLCLAPVMPGIGGPGVSTEAAGTGGQVAHIHYSCAHV